MNRLWKVVTVTILLITSLFFLYRNRIKRKEKRTCGRIIIYK